MSSTLLLLLLLGVLGYAIYVSFTLRKKLSSDKTSEQYKIANMSFIVNASVAGAVVLAVGYQYYTAQRVPQYVSPDMAG
jgi:hypothetical protein